MRVVIIGGTGHIGTYLTPRLVQGGHTTICVCRNQSQPYQSNGLWKEVQFSVMDRHVEEAAGSFGTRVANLEPDAVIDLTCYTLESATQLADSLRGRIQHFLHCGTIWVHGPSVQVPTSETQPRHPFGDYGCRKAAIEVYLLAEARAGRFPATILHPGHIVGPGWVPLNPAGNFNLDVFTAIAHGDELVLPNLGMETVHHVHADDVAQAFCRALAARSLSIGESFHVVSPAALTLRGYAESMYEWFGQQPKLSFLGWEDWSKAVSPRESTATWDHIAHSPNCSIAKAERLLQYRPRYGSLEAVEESVTWLIRNEKIRCPQATRI